MQVFDIYTYNLKQLKFKENKDFFDRVLTEYGFKYEDIGFCFGSDLEGALCDKIVGLFSELAPYRKYITAPKTVPEYQMSSISVGENGEISLHINREHINDFCMLLKKIPHSVNFNFMGVLLDNIDWNYASESKPCYEHDAAKRIIGDHCFTNYYSNSIRFIKEFDYGNKLNRVDILIEREWDTEKLWPCDTRFYEFSDSLGKPVSQKTVCVFDDAECEKLRIADEKIWNQIIEFKLNHYVDVGDGNQDITTDFSQIKGFTPKKFTSIARKYGFKYAKCVNGEYGYKKVNMYNHTFKVSFYMKPLSGLVFPEIGMLGYNFKFVSIDFPAAVVNSEENAESFAEKIFEFAYNLEKNFTDELFSCYGKTPVWYDV